MNGYAILAAWLCFGAIALFFALTTSTTRFHLCRTLTAFTGVSIAAATVYELAAYFVAAFTCLTASSC